MSVKQLAGFIVLCVVIVAAFAAVTIRDVAGCYGS
jgi:hypothetical protein